MSAHPADVERLLALTHGPEGGPVPPVLVLLAGVPGSGKSTFARLLASRIPAAHLDSDAARLALVQRPRYSRAESARLFAAMHEAVSSLLAAGRSVVVDATSALARHRAPLLAIAHEADARLVIVHVTAPEDLVLSRLAQRRTSPDRLDRSDAGERVYRRIAAQFEPIAEPHLRVDTSEDLDEAVAEVLRAIEEGADPR